MHVHVFVTLSVALCLVLQCYYIEPIQREVSRPVANGLPADKICTRLKKSSSEICSVMFGTPPSLSPFCTPLRPCMPLLLHFALQPPPSPLWMMRTRTTAR